MTMQMPMYMCKTPGNVFRFKASNGNFDFISIDKVNRNSINFTLYDNGTSTTTTVSVLNKNIQLADTSADACITLKLKNYSTPVVATHHGKFIYERTTLTEYVNEYAD